MKKQVTFNIDTDVHDKFCLALNLSEQTKDEATESCLKWYIANTFEKASQEYSPTKKQTSQKTTTGKQPSAYPYGRSSQINSMKGAKSCPGREKSKLRNKPEL